MTVRTDKPTDPPIRRSGVKRTAWLLAAVAIAIYVIFIASGVIGR